MCLNLCQQEVAVISEQRVKLFTNDRNQAVRIPCEFELPGQDAIVRKEGERLIIELPRQIPAGAAGHSGTT